MSSLPRRSLVPRAAGFYDPRTYDLEIGSSAGRAVRRAFYVAETAFPGARVLELGCGTGDICLAIAERGADVVGLDSSPDMIAAARRKALGRGQFRPFWIRARMEALPLRARFSAIIVPYHALFHVLLPSELDALLATALQHLEPGGVFLADVFSRRPDAPCQSLAVHESLTPEGVYRVDEDQRFDAVTGRMHTRFSYRLVDRATGDLVDAWTRVLEYLVTPPAELERRLDATGFIGVQSFIAFDRRQPTMPGEDAVIRALRDRGSER